MTGAYTPSAPEVSICIPTLGADYQPLFMLLESIHQHTGEHIDYEIVIISSGDRIRGYTGPMVQAMYGARGEFLFALTDDVTVPEGWIDPLLAELRAGTWCVFPDQSASEGSQAFCGWCWGCTRQAWDTLGGFDTSMLWWAADVDWAKRLHEAGHPPVCIELPTPVVHASNTTASRPEVSEWAGPQGMRDLDTYRAKWGSDANDDKYALRPIVR